MAIDFIYEQDVVVPMSDGIGLRANVFGRQKTGAFPSSCRWAVRQGRAFPRRVRCSVETLAGDLSRARRNGSPAGSCAELPDPERWVPNGFAVVSVDSRGSGKSPGYLDPYSPIETQDYAEAIEWAGRQPWSNGKVGLLGVSYLASKQWQVAARSRNTSPPSRRGRDAATSIANGAATGLADAVSRRLVAAPGDPNQHGNASSPYRDPDTGERTTGPTELSAEILAGNRSRFPDEILLHALDDAWYAAMTPDFSASKCLFCRRRTGVEPGCISAATSRAGRLLPHRRNGCRSTSAPISKASISPNTSRCRNGSSGISARR